MDVALLSRIQFAVTVGFHFLFPPVTIGLAWLLVVVETLGWRTGEAVYENIGHFFARLLGLTFAVGVATGVVMEFQFGTNWSRYSKFVGDIFGAPLAAEAIFAFFLESVFLGLYLFARDRVSRKVHWFSIVMVAIGSTLSAFWIIVANSWMQTPAGFTINPIRPDIPAYVAGSVIDPALYRAELTSFWQAVFNPSTVIHLEDRQPSGKVWPAEGERVEACAKNHVLLYPSLNGRLQTLFREPRAAERHGRGLRPHHPGQGGRLVGAGGSTFGIGELEEFGQVRGEKGAFLFREEVVGQEVIEELWAVVGSMVGARVRGNHGGEAGAVVVQRKTSSYVSIYYIARPRLTGKA
jgi:hypothetical protein